MAARRHAGRWPVRLASAVGFLALAGCGADADTDADAAFATDEVAASESADDATEGGATDDGAPTPAAGGEVCDLLTVEEVSGLLDAPARVDDSGPQVVAGSDCVWLADEVGLEQLHLQTFTSASHYRSDAWGASEPLEGIGDEAFLVRTGPLGTTAGYRDGDRVVLLNLQVLIGGGSSTAGDRADQVAELLTTIHGRDGG